MLDKICVTMKPYSDTCLSVQVLDREKKRSPHFLICNHVIDELFTNAYAEDTDLYNRCKMFVLDNGNIQFRMLFLSVSYDDHIDGFRRCFEVPADAVKKVRAGKTVKMMAQTDHSQCTPKITLTENAHAAVGKMNRTKRHAFTKALVEGFHSDDVVVSKDYGSDFCFTEKNAMYGSMIIGGLCLHQTTVRGRDGEEHDVIRYGKHT